MEFRFSKYHGTGNDFILIDDRDKQFPEGDLSLIKRICDRHFGIGADGLMLIREETGFDFRMIYFNSDGRESTMCGNGGRCIAAYVQKEGLETTYKAFMAIDGPHEYLLADGQVRLKMIDVEDIRQQDKDFVLFTGSPHFVRLANHIDRLDLNTAGRKIRYSPVYTKEGINVNFVESSEGSYRMRTYERGVEGETLSCGTGTIAAALALAIEDPDLNSPVTLETPGGTLRVYFDRKGTGFNNIWLEGPAAFVFEGTLDTDCFRA